jgi:hypothetical protein
MQLISTCREHGNINYISTCREHGNINCIAYKFWNTWYSTEKKNTKAEKL